MKTILSIQSFVSYGHVGNSSVVFPLQRLVLKAHIITPNQFELEYLSDTKISNLESAITACRKLISQGPKIVLVTSLILPDDSNEFINMLVVDENEAYLVKTPLLQLSVNG